MNALRLALVALCLALAASARADDAGQVDRWIDQALHGKGEERDRAVRFLAALGGDAVDRLLAAARREGAAAPAVPVAPVPVTQIPSAPVAPAPVVAPPAPQPVPPQPPAAEKRRYLVSGSFRHGDLRVPVEVEAIEGEPTAVPGPAGKVQEYRREPRREASGAWTVTKDTIRLGVRFEVTVQPVDGRIRLTLTTRVTTVARPIPTTTVRPAPDAPEIEVDAPQWSTVSETATADLAPGEEREIRPTVAQSDVDAIVLRLKVAPKP